MGAAALLQLAQRGQRVLGLEQHLPVHRFGSHTGQSRIFRQAYFEHPDYVPLLQAAHRGWLDLQQQASTQLYHETGLLYMGPPQHELLRGTRQSAALYGIPVSEQAGAKPPFHLPEGFHTLHEAGAGLVLPEECIAACIRLALQQGAEIRVQEAVHHWEVKDGLVLVHAAGHRYRARRIVLAAGAYTAALLPQLAPRLQVTRQLLAYFQPREPEAFALGRFPCWTLGLGGKPGVYYGFPILPADAHGNPAALKVALHLAGSPAEDPALVPAADPAALSPSDQGEVEDLRALLAEFLPSAAGPLVALQVCRYTNTPDLDFVLGMLPGYEDHVAVAAGFSGHGFKFVPVIGEVLADLAERGETGHPVSFLGQGRFA